MGYASGIQLFVFLARKLDMISCKRMIKRLMDIRMRIGCVACVACWGMGVAAQPLPPTGGWGLDDVVLQACQSSPDALAARHTFRSAYWDYRSFRADYLPSLTLTSGPNLDRSINQITMEDGSVRFVEQNLLNTDLSLRVQQNVSWTGGTLSLESSLLRTDLLSDRTFSWKSVPVNIGYSQSLFGYNNLKWRRRIEPVRYEEAQRSYLETMELVAARAVDKFFALAMAQSNYATACQNFAHADTLYRFAQGRYQIGTTTENEMLQLEINRLNEETNRLNARIEMDECALDLRSYLGLHEGDTLPAIRMVTEVPDVTVEEGAALQWAHLHSPDILYMKRRKLEAESNVAQAKANAGLKADLYLRFGLTQTAENFSSTYRHPLDQQAVSIGITLPILDWGKGRGQVRVGPFATGFGGDASGAEPHGLRPEYPQVGRAVQPARATCARGGPDGQHGLAPQRSGTPPVRVGKIQCARPQRLYRGEGCRAPELPERPAHLLESLLHPAQPDAL